MPLPERLLIDFHSDRSTPAPRLPGPEKAELVASPEGKFRCWATPSRQGSPLSLQHMAHGFVELNLENATSFPSLFFLSVFRWWFTPSFVPCICVSAYSAPEAGERPVQWRQMLRNQLSRGKVLLCGTYWFPWCECPRVVSELPFYKGMSLDTALGREALSALPSWGL